MSFDDPFYANTGNIDGDTSNNYYNFNDDPAADFLEREKRELGDITGNGHESPFNDPFSSTTPNNNLFTNGAHSPSLNTGGSNSPNPSESSKYQALSQMNEPETIRKWREEFTARIDKKDSEEQYKCRDMREQAKKELDDFYKQRSEQLERTKGQNRSNNRTLEDDIFNNGHNKSSHGKMNDWDKITSLCEFNPKNNRSQKDLTRYRSVLLQLKQQTTGK